MLALKSLIGTLSGNSMFDISTSTIGVTVTGASCVRSIGKGILSPMPWCKGLYFASAALNGVSCVTSGLCLVSGLSCIAPIPLLAGAVGYGTSIAARGCNSLADCMDPTVGLSAKAVDTCIDLATKSWS